MSQLAAVVAVDVAGRTAFRALRTVPRAVAVFTAVKAGLRRGELVAVLVLVAVHATSEAVAVEALWWVGVSVWGRLGYLVGRLGRTAVFARRLGLPSSMPRIMATSEHWQEWQNLVGRGGLG